ncbi:Oidioi.mRNA.OKI2018_I69.chr2.g7344.t1.cds [Oikopleura dioica]|uniref:Oidioi.mRNA.OKI2018_I69.chr2.g7344.t1.cds n=1 Tax=Oikopleura dioica TaxID=34765 RepID=A0ABN7T6I3_OIKDI|nr:Oidioi.mRNA.OKI2018_I69.chr2.g7344.t1.cds [Oikopleura dioica]
MTQEKILQNLAFSQIAITVATIIFHCYLAPPKPKLCNDENDSGSSQSGSSDDLDSNCDDSWTSWSIWDDWFVYYYGYSGLDTVFLCTGILSILAGHLKTLCSYSLSIFCCFSSFVCSVCFGFIGHYSNFFSTKLEMSVNLFLSISGGLVHLALIRNSEIMS